MPSYVIKDLEIFVDGTGPAQGTDAGHLTEVSNDANLEFTQDALDTTTFGNEWRQKQAGLLDGTFSASGFIHETKAGINKEIYDSVTAGSAGRGMIIAPNDTLTVGSAAIYIKPVTTAFSWSTSLGAMATYGIAATFTETPYRGVFLGRTTGPGTGVTLTFALPTAFVGTGTGRLDHLLLVAVLEGDDFTTGTTSVELRYNTATPDIWDNIFAQRRRWSEYEDASFPTTTPNIVAVSPSFGSLPTNGSMRLYAFKVE